MPTYKLTIEVQSDCTDIDVYLEDSADCLVADLRDTIGRDYPVSVLRTTVEKIEEEDAK